MQDKRLGRTLVVVGTVGAVLMTAAVILLIAATVRMSERVSAITDPAISGIEDIDSQLAAVDGLVGDFLMAFPEETVADLANRLSGLSVRLETIGGYIEVARRGLTAIDGIPFLPVDLGAVSAELDGLDEDLAVFKDLLADVTRIVQNNQELPQQVAEAVGSGVSKLRVGLENARSEIGAVSDAVSWWLNGGLVIAAALLVWGIGGQFAAIALGRRMQGPGGLTASS